MLPRPRLTGPARQHGLTLIELMIAMTLGMGVILMASTLLLAARNSYLSIHDSALMQDTGRHALEVIAQAVRQANFVPHDDPDFAAINLADIAAGISGLDNSQVNSKSNDIQHASRNNKHHRSDVLAIQFFGAADGSQSNCAGFVAGKVSAEKLAKNAGQQRSWSIFFIDADANGVPELRCKYSTHAGNWNVDAIARGVEALQVLYGIGESGDSGDINASVTSYLPAAKMSKAQWSQVIAVRVALLIRGEHATGEAAGNVYRLFGDAYQNGDDAVVTIGPRNHPRKPRKVFDMNVRLRNTAS